MFCSRPWSSEISCGPALRTENIQKFYLLVNRSKKPHNFRFYTLSQGCIHLCNFYFYSFLHWTRDKEKIRYSTTFEEYYEWKSESSNAKTVHLVYLLTLNSRDFTALPNRVFRFQSNTGGRREHNIFRWPP